MDVARLREMRRLVAAGWTKRTLARTADGEDCSPLLPHATCFCIAGASSAARMPISDWTDFAAFAGFEYGASGLVDFNDDPATRKIDILDLIDRAIEHFADKPEPETDDSRDAFLFLAALNLTLGLASFGCGDSTPGIIFCAIAAACAALALIDTAKGVANV